MKIDEERDEIDISDHCMLTVTAKGNKIKRVTKKWITDKYMSFEKDKVEKYKQAMEMRLQERREINFVELNTLMKEEAKKTLMKTYRRKLCEDGRKEPPWMNREIRTQIKRRKQINKAHRKAENTQQKARKWEEYKIQKEKVRRLIVKEMREHERKLAQRLKQGGSRNLWKNIEKLKGTEKRKQEVKIYTENGECLRGRKVGREISHYWRTIYKKHPNRMDQHWGPHVREQYKEQLQRVEREQRTREQNGQEDWRRALPRIIVDKYNIGTVRWYHRIHFIN